jgi:acyl carrier protein
VSETLQAVESLVCQIGNLPATGADADIYDSGFSSVNALSLLIELETAFNVSIPDDRFVTARTVRDLAAMIRSLNQEQGQ